MLLDWSHGAGDDLPILRHFQNPSADVLSESRTSGLDNLELVASIFHASYDPLILLAET